MLWYRNWGRRQAGIAVAILADSWGDDSDDNDCIMKGTTPIIAFDGWFGLDWSFSLQSCVPEL